MIPLDNRPRLVLLSALMLFVELALIRWMGSNIIYLSYFSNFVLLGSFLGIGLGFLRGTRGRSLFTWAPAALALLVTAITVFPVQIDRSGEQLIFFGSEPSGPPIWVVLPVIFLAVAVVLMMVANGVARVFHEFDALEAYRLDILGSIAGIVVFSILSFLSAPPVAWGVVVTILFVLTADRPGAATPAPRWLPVVALAPLLVLVGLLARESMTSGLSWSPYYKVLAYTPADDPQATTINVNGIPHQSALDIRDRDAELPLYLEPYTVGDPHPKEVLIIGAGSGNDVAEALAHGAAHVDAVEIDPRIHQLGVDRHPNRPYADPRVTTHLDDGRAFIERTDKTYDLIVLALPDSLTLVAGQSSLRLESYLFTSDAFTSYREHLNPTGVFTMYNVYRETWLRDRYAGSLREAFGSDPCIATVDGAGTVAALTVGYGSGNVHCTRVWAPDGAVPSSASDDYPFPYLRDRTIPPFYLITMGLILIASLVLVRGSSDGGMKPMRSYVDLFAMGAAFLLLETKSVVQFALLFGTTWFVNALVFIGVLLSVYLAVELSIRWKRMPPASTLYGGLLASLAVAWAVPLSSLLALGFGPRFVIAVAITFAPVFFANLIFAQRFRDVGSSTAAFGANLLGAMVGGLLEYTALLTGYRNLLILVALLYGAAYVLGRRTWMRGGEPAAPAREPVPV